MRRPPVNFLSLAPDWPDEMNGTVGVNEPERVSSATWTVVHQRSAGPLLPPSADAESGVVRAIDWLLQLIQGPLQLGHAELLRDRRPFWVRLASVAVRCRLGPRLRHESRLNVNLRGDKSGPVRFITK